MIDKQLLTRYETGRSLWRKLRALNEEDTSGQQDAIAKAYRELTDLMNLIDDGARLAIGGSFDRAKR